MKILISGTICKNKETVDKIKELGHTVFLVEDETLPLEKQNDFLSEFDWVICNGLFLYNDITKFSSLKAIQLTSAGLDRVPLRYIEERGIKLFAAAGVYSVPMAEFAVCGVLQLYKSSRFFYNNQKTKTWEKKRDLIELFGKTAAIIGCGNAGDEGAKRFSAFGCDIVGVDIETKTSPLYSKIFPVSELENVMKKSDIIILTLPLTDKTKKIVNADNLKRAKNGAVIVNISRGGVLDTEALIASLNSNLKGAVLDVFEDEPLPSSSPLWKMENVIITPHNAFVGDGNEKRLENIILSNLKKYG